MHACWQKILLQTIFTHLKDSKSPAVLYLDSSTSLHSLQAFNIIEKLFLDKSSQTLIKLTTTLYLYHLIEVLLCNSQFL